MPRSDYYIPVFDSLPGHKKEMALRETMGWNGFESVGFLVWFWLRVAADFPNGELPGLDGLAATLRNVWKAAGIKPKRKQIQLVAKALCDENAPLVEVEIVEDVPVVIVHDWEDGAGMFALKRKKEADKKRLQRAKQAQSDVPGTPDPCPPDVPGEKETQNSETRNNPKYKTKGGCRGNAPPPASDSEPPSFSSSSSSSSLVPEFSDPHEIPWESLDASHVFGVFRDVFIENGIASALDLSVKARKCRVSPCRWTMLFFDKLQYAAMDEDLEPVAMTMAGFLPKSGGKQHSPTDASGALFREAFVDLVGNGATRGERWKGMDSGLVAAELLKRKGK